MILSPDQVRETYRQVAPGYDRTLWLYRLLGLRALRRRAVNALRLTEGATVVDLCCGTGANLALLHQAVGDAGRIIGVDISSPMLSRAERRRQAEGWSSVELIEADVAEWTFPANLDGVLSTFGLEMVPAYDRVIATAAGALRPGGRLVLFGLRHPANWPDWAVRLGVRLNRKYGVSRDYEAFRPWESAGHHLDLLEYRSHSLGAAYTCIARKS